MSDVASGDESDIASENESDIASEDESDIASQSENASDENASDVASEDGNASDVSEKSQEEYVPPPPPPPTPVRSSTKKFENPKHKIIKKSKECLNKFLNEEEEEETPESIAAYKKFMNLYEYYKSFAIPNNPDLKKQNHRHK